MKKEEFDKLVKGKSESELTRILNRYTNDLIKLTSGQVNKIIKMKNKKIEVRKNMENIKSGDYICL